MPAFCSPLNGVWTADGWPGSQPRLNGRLGSLNHRPRWNWWVGSNVVVPPCDTENVSRSKMPRTEAKPTPAPLAFTSVWYQDTPNGLPGCWITNRSNSAFFGMPVIVTFIRSFCEPGMMVTTPRACGRQVLIAGDEACSANVNGRSAEWPVTGAAEAAVRLSALAAATAAAPAAAQVTARRRRCLTMSIGLLPCGQRRRHGGAAGVGQEYAAPGSPGSDFFRLFFFEPSALPAAYLLPTDEPDGATRCGQQCDLAPPTTTRS